MLERDCKLAEREDERRGRQQERERENIEEGETAELDRKRRNALLLLSKGQISKAVRTITSNGMADIWRTLLSELKWW